MTKPSDRRLNKKFVKVPSGKTKEVRYRTGGRKASCGLCAKPLQGTPKGKVSEIRKLSRTEKRPSVMFGGVLCNACRDKVFEDAIKVKFKTKAIADVKVSLRKYVDQAVKAIKA